MKDLPLFVRHEGLVHSRLIDYEEKGPWGSMFYTSCKIKFRLGALYDRCAEGPVTCLECLSRGQTIGEMPT